MGEDSVSAATSAKGASRISLVCIDVDGTLIGAAGVVEPDVWVAVERARAAGMHLAVSSGRGVATARFTLSRPAQVVLQVETPGGVVVRALPPVSLGAGARSVRWDGRLPLGTRAYAGPYVAHVLVTSDVGASDLSVAFIFRR